MFEFESAFKVDEAALLPDSDGPEVMPSGRRERALPLSAASWAVLCFLRAG